MANPTHGTLGAAAVTTVTVAAGAREIGVLNKDSSDRISVTLDGSTPTEDGDGTYTVLPGSQRVFGIDQGVSPGSATAVKLISAGTPAYEVEGAY